MSSNHGMIPGTHEWPRTPQCRCGADWDRWNDRCCRNEQANERIGGTGGDGGGTWLILGDGR